MCESLSSKKVLSVNKTACIKMDGLPCEPESLPSYILKSMCKTLPSFPKVSAGARLCVFGVNKAEKLDKTLRKITTEKNGLWRKTEGFSLSSKWPGMGAGE